MVSKQGPYTTTTRVARQVCEQVPYTCTRMVARQVARQVPYCTRVLVPQTVCGVQQTNFGGLLMPQSNCQGCGVQVTPTETAPSTTNAPGYE